LLAITFFFIPPITTISPSATSSLVTISILLIGGSSDSAALFGVSLFTLMLKSTFPSPIMLGVTSNFNAASLNDVVVVPSDVVW
jgi:hypothetical protein